MNNNLYQFWALELQPGKTYKQTPSYDLHLTQAALGLNPNKERNVVQCEVNGSLFVLGSVTLGKIDQFSLNHRFEKGKPVEFSISGQSSVYLSGFYIIDSSPVVSEKQKLQMLLTTPARDDKKISQPAQRIEVKTPNKRAAQDLEPSSPDNSNNSNLYDSPVTPGRSSKKNKLEKQVITAEPSTPTTPKSIHTTPKAKNPLVQRLPNGLIIEDILVGIGKQTVVGHKVTVNYIGKLFPGGQKFDSGKNFSFRLGMEQVIKGWDIGLKGMKVGGKRSLTIPP